MTFTLDGAAQPAATLYRWQGRPHHLLTRRRQPLLTASYSGDVPIAASISTTLTQKVVAAPTANAQSASTLVNKPVAITLTGSDPNTPPLPLAFTITAPPTHGTLPARPRP